MKDAMVDHLFRHEYGKMVASLTKLYGLHNLELIEDAVQDTFHKAVIYLRNHPPPDNLQAYIRKSVRNRAIDLFRKASTQQKYESATGPTFMTMAETFSSHELEDSQLRMLFTACHPALKPKEQIIFALKMLSGFSVAEIGHALLVDAENIKKTLQRARKKVGEKGITFSVPSGTELADRLHMVHLAIYLLFNEGFHSSSSSQLIRKDLMAEALRLCDLVLEKFDDSQTSALMALMCFNGSRIDAKVDDNENLILLMDQDRSKWNYDLIWRGNIHMEKATEGDRRSMFHYEAAIAGEYVSAYNFKDINWERLEFYHEELQKMQPSPLHLLNLAAVQHKRGLNEKALATLHQIDTQKLKSKKYLYYSISAEIFIALKDKQKGVEALHMAIKTAVNVAEKKLLWDKLSKIS